MVHQQHSWNRRRNRISGRSWDHSEREFCRTRDDRSIVYQRLLSVVVPKNRSRV